MTAEIARPDREQVARWVAQVKAAKLTTDPTAEQAAREAFARLHARFYRPLMAALRRRGATADAAHDHATDALLLLWEAPERFDPRRCPLPLLVVVANNRRISELRKHSRVRPLTDADRDAVPAREPEPVVAAARAESARLLRAALDALPRPLSSVMVRYQQGEPRKSAAARLGLTPRRMDTLRAAAVRALIAACPALASRG